MKLHAVAIAGALAGALAGCEAKPAPGATAPNTTIQHDAPGAAEAAKPAQPGSTDSATALPPGHPKLGDGEASHEQQAGSMPPGHPAINRDDTDAKALLEKVEAMKGELQGRPKTVEIVVALGSLYYDNGRYLDAVDWYRQAIEQSAPLVEGWKKLQAALGDTSKLKPSGLSEAGCDREQVKDSEPMMARAQQLAAEGKAAQALACGKEALRPVVMAHARRGNAFYLIGNPGSAVAEHERALALDPDNAESLFFRGAILFDAMGDDVPKLKLAKQSWQRFLEVDPQSPRAGAVKEMLPQLDQAIALGGASKLPRPEDPATGGNPHGQGGPVAGPLDPGAAEAVQNADIDADTIKGMQAVLDESLGQIAKGDLPGAVGNLKRVFPFVMSQPDKFPPAFRARTNALMSLYMASKGAPMAGSLLSQAVATDPATVDAVADALAQKGDKAHAKQLWGALISGDPAYAQAHKLADKAQ